MRPGTRSGPGIEADHAMTIGYNTHQEHDRRAPERSSRQRLSFWQLCLLFLACPLLMSFEDPPDTPVPLTEIDLTFLDDDYVDYSQFEIDLPLTGFDLSVLRPNQNNDSYVYPITKLTFKPRALIPTKVEIELALEFGNTSGLAEAWQKDVMIRAIINDQIG